MPQAEHLTGRRCIVDRQVRPMAAMVRFAAAPDGALVPDIARRLPGRGIWVSAERRAVDAAVQRKLFDRAASCTLTVPGDLTDRVERLLAASCLNLLGLARRAGEVVSGYEQVATAVAVEPLAALLTAADAGQHGKRKIAAKSKGYETDAPMIALFDSGELGLALGRGNVVHAALRPGGLATRFLAEWVRLDGFRVARQQEPAFGRVPAEGDGTGLEE